MTATSENRRGSSFANQLAFCLVIGFACAMLSGCVQRRMTIRSNPPGALVYVDNYEIGRTPVSTDFIYYGTRRIRLEADGYQTYTAEQHFWPPWYEVPPLDFVSENLWPWEIRDERVVDFTLTPQIIVPTEALLARGNELRRGTQVAAGPAVIMPGVPTAPGPLQPLPTQPMFPAPVQPTTPTLPPGRQYETLPPGGQILPEPPPKTGWKQWLWWWK